MQKEITVYVTETCPKCRRLKDFLQANQITFKTLDMQSSEGMSELLFYQVFTYDAPVLQIGDAFYTTKQLFDKNELREEIKKALGV